jgi:Rad3-related DNA helicase
LRDRLPVARLVVVDEAHHLSSWAWSSDQIEKSIYGMVATATAELHRRVCYYQQLQSFTTKNPFWLCCICLIRKCTHLTD